MNALAGAVFSDTITLGAVLISALAGLALVVGVFYGVRYRVAYEAEAAAATALRESLSDSLARGVRADELIRELREHLAEAKNMIVRLEARPDYKQIVELLDKHETRAQERHDQTANVLLSLVTRLEHLATTS